MNEDENTGSVIRAYMSTSIERVRVTSSTERTNQPLKLP
jgi:hypothetical protein